MFVQVFEMEEAAEKPNKKVLMEHEASKSDIVTFNPFPCTSALFCFNLSGGAELAFQVRGRCMSHDSVTQLENTPFIRNLLSIVSCYKARPQKRTRPCLSSHGL